MELRRLLAPSIVWSAVTTAGAFALLNFAGLPGLSQLGSLIAVGVLLAAVVMLFGFLPLAGRTATAGARVSPPAAASNGEPAAGGDTRAPLAPPVRRAQSERWAWPATALFALLIAIALLRAWPQVDHGTRALQPGNIPAQIALDELQAETMRHGEPFCLLVSGRDEDEVARRLDILSTRVSAAKTNGVLRDCLLPTALWPHAGWQQTNLVLAAQLARETEAFRSAALKTGFTSNSLALAEGVLHAWQGLAGSRTPIWPTNEAAQWLLKRAAARTAEGWLAAGAVYPSEAGARGLERSDLGNATPGVWLTGWSLLGEELLLHVERRLWWIMVGMIVLIGACLWLAFRRWQEVLLSFATLGFGLLVLLAVMSVAGWSWNLMNFVALPLLLGAGVDYTIHVQLALRRHGGDVRAVRRVTGRAVFLCAATTVTGFGSLAWSSSAGLASLGLVCATGVAIACLMSVCLLPAWWVLASPKSEVRSPKSAEVSTAPAAQPTSPPAFYQARLWRVGLALVRVTPAPLLNALCVVAAEIYRLTHPARRQVVVRNLLPVVQGDRAAAEKAARSLFRNFARKLADLWRFEAGFAPSFASARLEGWEHLIAAHARGQGVLLIGPHLGNWEVGSVLLAQRGLKLVIISLAEPGEELTALRTASRVQWGVETLVIGQDAFAFVEVIKRLQQGAIMAVLIDRPKEAGAVVVEFFGKPFRASPGAAELARASGCALLGVTVVRHGDGYSTRVLPEFPYDRRALGSREERRALTEQILRAFEPEIRQHPDQWYHFVPLWPEREREKAE